MRRFMLMNFRMLIRTNTGVIMSFMVLFVAASNAAGQENQSSLKISIKRDAEKMGKAFIKNDYEKFVLFIPPKALGGLGGKAEVISKMVKEEKMMKSQKIKFQQVDFDEPSDVVKNQTSLQSLIQQRTAMSVPGGKLLSKAYLLAVSYNNGVNWSFLDVSTLSVKQVRALLPEFNQNLKIPDWEEPEFVKK